MFGLWEPPWWLVILIFLIMLPIFPFFLLGWICKLILKATEYIINWYGSFVSKIIN